MEDSSTKAMSKSLGGSPDVEGNKRKNEGQFTGVPDLRLPWQDHSRTRTSPGGHADDFEVPVTGLAAFVLKLSKQPLQKRAVAATDFLKLNAGNHVMRRMANFSMHLKGDFRNFQAEFNFAARRQNSGERHLASELGNILNFRQQRRATN